MADENNSEKEIITETRKRFFEDNGDILNEFDDKDLKRLQHDDLWVSCFTRSREQNVLKSVEAINICLRWRKTFGLNELTERQIDRRLFETGFLFLHNRDREGNSIIIFTGKLHKKDAQQHSELKRFLVFMLERHARMYPSRKITLIFDMQEAGLGNMDMDFVKFIITCFTNYFPNTLAWLLVVELPWILTAAWKIVKTWLSPEAVNKIKFLNKADLTEYLEEDKILERLGGKDNYQYSYPQSQEDSGLGPPERDIESMDGVNLSNSHLNVVNGVSNSDSSLQHEHPLRDEATEGPRTTKVTFDEENLAGNASANNNSEGNHGKKEERPLKLTSKTVRESKPVTFVDEKSPSTKLLSITPVEELVFGGTPNSGGELLQTLTLDNNSTKNVAFKVKTTSPGSYRVRPSAGVISPASFADVSVYLQPGHASSVCKDKFLVMSTEVSEGMSPTEIAAVWRTTPKSSILDHRLRCSIVSTIIDESHHIDTEIITDSKTSEVQSSSMTEQLKNMERKIDRIEKKISYIEEGLQMFIKIQIGLFSLMVILFSIGFYYFMYLI